jgi:uncharacterized membrane protein
LKASLSLAAENAARGENMRKLQLIAIALVALSFATAYVAYPSMPQSMASHWNFEGNVDGYMPRDAGVYFMPLLGAAMLALLYFLPSIDPKKENYRKFQVEYDEMVVIITAFLYYIYLLTLVYNLGYSFNLLQLLAPGFGALFLYVGVVLGKAKQNWFVGIRTPWTMSSERVWDKTHEMGSKMFKAAGVIALLGVMLPQMFVAAIAVVIAAAVATFAYSYVEYRKEKMQDGVAKRKGKRTGKKK